MIRKLMSKIKYICYKIKSIFSKNLRIGINGRYDSKSEIVYDKKSILEIGNNCSILRNVSIRVREKGKLQILNNVFINNNCVITCRNNIKIDNNVIIGPNVCIFDHDHDYKYTEKRNEHFILGEINIGKNVWIGAGAIILKGADIGDNSVIAAGAIVNCKVDNDTVFYSKDKQREIKYDEKK